MKETKITCDVCDGVANSHWFYFDVTKIYNYTVGLVDDTVSNFHVCEKCMSEVFDWLFEKRGVDMNRDALKKASIGL